MAYKNTIKLFVSNFALVWKQLLYLLICGCIFVLCIYSTSLPFISLLKNNGVIEELNAIFQTVYNSPSEFALRLSESFSSIFSVIFANFSSLWLSFIAFIVFGILLPYILVQMSFYNLSSILYQKISMNMNVRYVQNMLQTFVQSLKYALATFLFNLPFFAISILAICLFMLTAKTIISSIISLIILSAVLIAIRSIKITLFTGYTSFMVINNAGPFVSLAKGIACAIKNFWKTLSTSIIITLTIIFVSGILTIFTFFAGLIIVVPAAFVFLAIYNLVVYFNSIGERYYLGANLIYNPTKYVIKQEDYTEAKIPEISSKPKVTTTKIKSRKKSKEKNDN